jgi:predicted DNA-binding protein (MmcQ/YjbR family)
MDIEFFRDFCLSKKGVEESFPFGDDTLVMKLMGKIFALANLDGDLKLNLKCNPEYAIELREKFAAVSAGYHMNKKHWNTISIDGSISDQKICSWINHSYSLIYNNLTKKEKDILEQMP